jgi:hypothetical protein
MALKKKYGREAAAGDLVRDVALGAPHGAPLVPLQGAQSRASKALDGVDRLARIAEREQTRFYCRLKRVCESPDFERCILCTPANCAAHSARIGYIQCDGSSPMVQCGIAWW